MNGMISGIKDSTSDWFLGDQLIIEQPREGFRAGFDSVVLGAAVAGLAKAKNITQPKLLDLGCGVGVAGLVAAFWSKAATLTGVEKNEAYQHYFMRNAGQLKTQSDFIALDVGVSGAQRAQAGMIADWADIVLANPPYYASNERRAPKDATKAAAFFLAEGGLRPWVQAALSASHARAWLVFILPTTALAEILALISSKLGDITVMPLLPRAAQSSHRIIVRGQKGAKGPLTLLPGTIVHQAGRRDYTPTFAKVLQGKGWLEW